MCVFKPVEKPPDFPPESIPGIRTFRKIPEKTGKNCIQGYFPLTDLCKRFDSPGKTSVFPCPGKYLPDVSRQGIHKGSLGMIILIMPGYNQADIVLLCKNLQGPSA